MTATERDAHVKELQHEFYRLFLRRRRNAIELAQSIDPTIEPAAYTVLFTLQKEGSQRMTAISRHLGIGKPTLSRQLAALEQRGFITKTADPDDGRALVVALSDEGRHRLEAAQSERAQRYMHMLEPWSEDEIMNLSGLLRKLNQTYSEYNAEYGPGNGLPSGAVPHGADEGHDGAVSQPAHAPEAPERGTA